MVSVQLMILKGINVGYRVITDQFIVFIIFSLSQHIGILRITCIEEGVPNTVGLSKCISQVTKSCQFQFLTVTVVIKLVESRTSGFKCAIKSIFCGFIGIACTQCSQQTQILSIYIPVLSAGYITAKFRKTCTLIHIEGCMKRIFLRNGSRKVRLRHVNVLLINARITEQGILLIHFIEILENCIEPASRIETDGEKVFSGIFFGTDVDVCS